MSATRRTPATHGPKLIDRPRLSSAVPVDAYSHRSGRSTTRSPEARIKIQGRTTLRRAVEDGLYVVAIRIENKSTVVVGMVLRAQTWWPIVSAASGYSRLVEGVYFRSRLGAEGCVDGRLVGRAPADPEIRLRWFAEASYVSVARHRCREFSKERIANWRERRGIKRLALGEVAHRNSGVVDHGTNGS
jgi:hypothetical protein